MSVQLVNEEIAKFLSTGSPAVLCIRGKWGVGKSHTWDHGIKEAQRTKAVDLERYSYVSLFGVNSLGDLKSAVFENVISLDSEVRKADIETLDAFVNKKIGPWRKLFHLVGASGVANRYGGGAMTALSFLTIRKQIVCFDDLERRGKGLDIADVLGLASFLREQRDCKVVLILNDEELLADEKPRFESYLEKVVDVSLAFQPTAAESIAIAIKGSDSLSKMIADLCKSLGIANIRVIRRIERHVNTIRSMLQKFEAEVFETAARSVALFCWSHDQPGEAPTLEFLTTKKAKSVAGLGRKKGAEGGELLSKEAAREAAWNALLDAYGYRYTDEFDLALIKGIKDGYFDPGEIERLGGQANEQVIANKANGSFEEAWGAYHDSFDDNQAQVLDTIYVSFMKNYRYVTPLNLNGTVNLFKELGRQDQALEMIRHYVDKRAGDRALFNLDESLFGGDIQDPDVRQAFAEQCAIVRDEPNVREMLLALKVDLSDEIVLYLAAVPVEEYRKVLKGSREKELRRILAGALQFDRILNATPAMLKIAQNTREALKQIGAESPINARRVSRYGVQVGRADPTPQACVAQVPAATK